MSSSSDLSEARRNLASTSIDLLVNVGLISAVLDRFPEHVEENFVGWIEQTTKQLEQCIEEAQSFGEHYDEQIDSDSNEGD